jgi:hypothetical protein
MDINCNTLCDDLLLLHCMHEKEDIVENLFNQDLVANFRPD